MICAAYYSIGLGLQIAEAFGLTALIFVSLTLYTFASGKNFSFLGGWLFSALMCMLCVGFLGIFFPVLVTNIFYPVIGALLFCGYIVFDTWKISSVYGYDDY